MIMADMYEKMLESSLAHVGLWAGRCDRLAYLLYRTMEGDDVSDEVWQELRNLGYVDNDCEWKYDE